MPSPTAKPLMLTTPPLPDGYVVVILLARSLANPRSNLHLCPYRLARMHGGLTRTLISVKCVDTLMCGRLLVQSTDSALYNPAKLAMRSCVKRFSRALASRTTKPLAMAHKPATAVFAGLIWLSGGGGKHGCVNDGSACV